MFGSDWPVCLLSGEYEDVIGIIDSFIATLTPAEQSLIWGDTASRVYGFT
jgi:L-fuconolactonase